MSVYSAGPLDLPLRHCAIYSGTNASNFIGPIFTPSVATRWKATFYDKKRYLGECRIAVGGPCRHGGVENKARDRDR